MQPTQQLKSAYEYYNQGEYISALNILTSLMIQYEFKPIIVIWGGNCASLAGNYDLAMQFFQVALKQQLSKDLKIMCLENVVKTYFNQKMLTQAQYYVSELKQQQRSNPVAAIVEAEFKIRQFLVNQSAVLYLKQIIQNNIQSEYLCYLRFQKLRMQLMLNEPVYSELVELQSTPIYLQAISFYDVFKDLTPEQKQQYCPMLPLKTQSQFKIYSGELSEESLKYADDLLKLYSLFNKEGIPQFSFEVVQTIYQNLFKRFFYILEGKDEFKLLQLVVAMKQDSLQDRTLLLLSKQFGSILHNIALYYFQKQDEAIFEILIATLYMKSNRRFSYEQLVDIHKEISQKNFSSTNLRHLSEVTTENVETLAMFAVQTNWEQLAISLFFTTLQTKITYREHLQLLVFRVIRDFLPSLLRKKTLDEFLAEGTCQQLLFLLSSIEIDDFDILEKFKTQFQGRLVEDKQAQLGVAFIYAKRIQYTYAQLVGVQLANKHNLQHPLKEKDPRKCILLLQDELKQLQAKCSSLVYKALSKGAHQQQLVNALIIMLAWFLSCDHIDIEQYQFVKLLYGQLEIKPQKLTSQMALLSLKWRNYVEASQYADQFAGPISTIIKLRCAQELGNSQMEEVINQANQDESELLKSALSGVKQLNSSTELKYKSTAVSYCNVQLNNNQQTMQSWILNQKFGWE
ncbi:Tetratricopeptide-like_helical domain superfamily [Hexamita inflata]|uniref:Tetratricopeptide-like helical domain superfamily n=1 Tax=Hexamita inflata TaxID=28002 RepID=A0AA86TY96_9EUKA|nr:Tetratricopeptide-like helical domain superfamily [Hexamita inflata]CAI9950610.1 Tetratricopeptide-like helical domain superfamily [Hexamita inflata]